MSEFWQGVIGAGIPVNMFLYLVLFFQMHPVIALALAAMFAAPILLVMVLTGQSEVSHVTGQ